MLTLIVAIILTGAFWNYGKEMRTGKWFSIAVLWVAFLSFWSLGLGGIGTLLGAILAGLVLVVYGHMNDKVRMEEKRRATDSIRRCARCSNALVGPVSRCEKCGAAAVA